jgi:Protein of unknown function, DUF481
MNKTFLLSLVALLFLAGAEVVAARDRIELEDGSVVLGKILSADGGKLQLETIFAGTIEIAQAKIKNLTTDEPVNVSFLTGSVVLGKVEPSAEGIKIVGAEQQVTSPTGKIAAIWRQGTDSPEQKKLKAEAAARKHKWTYEAAFSLTGRTGESEKIDGALAFKATLASSRDKLVLSAAAERARDSGVDTANRQYLSADYTTFTTEENGWYARSSLERDLVRELDLRSNTAVGLTHRLIKDKHEDLQFRLGGTYVYENYSNDTTFESPGLDVAFLYTYNFTTAKLTDEFGYQPAFKDFSNYRVHNLFGYEIPLGASKWKLKLGTDTEYQSTPPLGADKLDTTYFTSLLLTM